MRCNDKYRSAPSGHRGSPNTGSLTLGPPPRRALGAAAGVKPSLPTRPRSAPRALVGPAVLAGRKALGLGRESQRGMQLIGLA